MKSLREFVVNRDRFAAARRWLPLPAVLLAVLGLYGPRFGSGFADGVAIGRDLVIVIDLSRSMAAEDIADRAAPARWQAAVAGAKQTLDLLRRRGGQRVGLVVFAARPLTLVPLTTDLDHAEARLNELDILHPPAEITADEASRSGTRIGEALKLAVTLHDPRFPNVQDILLFTDGDDPVADDEWKAGVAAARYAKIPVHVTGLGDPARDSFILVNGEALEGPTSDGVMAQIQTRLHADVVQALAADTRGKYLAAETRVPAMEPFVNSIIDSEATRVLEDDRLPRPRRWSHLCFAMTALLLLATWWRPKWKGEPGA